MVHSKPLSYVNNFSYPESLGFLLLLFSVILMDLYVILLIHGNVLETFPSFSAFD